MGVSGMHGRLAKICKILEAYRTCYDNGGLYSYEKRLALRLHISFKHQPYLITDTLCHQQYE